MINNLAKTALLTKDTGFFQSVGHYQSLPSILPILIDRNQVELGGLGVFSIDDITRRQFYDVLLNDYTTVEEYGTDEASLIRIDNSDIFIDKESHVVVGYSNVSPVHQVPWQLGDMIKQSEDNARSLIVFDSDITKVSHEYNAFGSGYNGVHIVLSKWQSVLGLTYEYGFDQIGYGPCRVIAFGDDLYLTPPYGNYSIALRRENSLPIHRLYMENK